MAQPFSAVATADRLYQGQPGTAVGTLYTAPAYASGSPYQAGATALAKRLIATNVTGSYKGTLTDPLNGPTSVTLATALVSGTAYTSLSVTALVGPINVGDSVILTSGTDTQTFTASAAAAAGATTIDVDSLAANFSYPVGTAVTNTNSSLVVSALSAPVLSGDSIVLTSGTNTQTFTASAYAAPGATAIPVDALAANFAYPAASTVADITSTPATLTLYLVPSGGTAEGATMICNQMQVAGGDPTIIDLEQSLAPGDTIQGFQGTGDALTVTLSGATLQ